MKVIICLLVVFAFHVAVKGLTVLSKYNFQTLLDFLILLAHEKKMFLYLVNRLFSHHMVTNRHCLSGTYRSREISLDLLDILQYLHIALQPVAR